MAGNSSLNAAARAKKDEFYTQLPDIEQELRHYRKHFKGKTVFCNCDDPFESNFFKYFVLNFNKLGLKKVIATCYRGSPIAGQQLSMFDEVTEEEQPANKPYKAVVTKVYDATGDGGISMLDVAALFRNGENELTLLEGDGDFRSPECLALLDEADIVCTNPPFSLFREYVSVLMEHEKHFLIIGPQNAITYQDFFPLLRDNMVWLGTSSPKEFIVPVEREDRSNTYTRNDGTVFAKFGNVCWYTNLDVKTRHEELIVFKRYSADAYPKYENYDGINVDSLDMIPCDYAGVMGVPITIMEHYNPDQFEIIGFGKGTLARNIGVTKNYRGRTDLAYVRPDGSHQGVYCHVLIRNRHPEEPKQ